MVVVILVQAEVTRLRRERSELEDRAEEAEGGLAAAQADMETGRKALQRELADERTEARRTAEEAKLEHSSQVRLVTPVALAMDMDVWMHWIACPGAGAGHSLLGFFFLSLRAWRIPDKLPRHTTLSSCVECIDLFRRGLADQMQCCTGG